MIQYACPKCKLVLEKINSLILECTNCNSQFPIKDNIPILLLDMMEPLDFEDIIEANKVGSN